MFTDSGRGRLERHEYLDQFLPPDEEGHDTELLVAALSPTSCPGWVTAIVVVGLFHPCERPCLASRR